MVSLTFKILEHNLGQNSVWSMVNKTEEETATLHDAVHELCLLLLPLVYRLLYHIVLYVMTL